MRGSEMFNPQLKEAFMRKYTTSGNTQKLLLYIFRKTGEVESKYGIDFCRMNVPQTKEAFDNASGVKTNGAGAVLKILKMYINWCTANGLWATDAIQFVRIDGYEKLRNSHLASPHHLAVSLDAAFPHPEENEIEYIYRSFLWLGYIGLQDTEAIRVTASNLNFDTMKLTFPKHREPYEFYTDSKPDLLKAAYLTSFTESRCRGHRIAQRAEGNEILRGKPSKKSMEERLESTFRPFICRAFKAAAEHPIEQEEKPSLKLNYKSVYASGLFYRTYERERRGVSPKFDEIIMKERRMSREEYSQQTPAERNYFDELIRNTRKDYENWRSVFT